MTRLWAAYMPIPASSSSFAHTAYTNVRRGAQDGTVSYAEFFDGVKALTDGGESATRMCFDIYASGEGFVTRAAMASILEPGRGRAGAEALSSSARCAPQVEALRREYHCHAPGGVMARGQFGALMHDMFKYPASFPLDPLFSVFDKNKVGARGERVMR